MSEIQLANTNNSLELTNNNGAMSAGALFALANDNSEQERYGVNPYYHHIQCKLGTSGYFNIFKPVQAKEGEENKIAVLNPEIVNQHRIIGLEGDIVELKFGFAQNIMKCSDVREGENKYVRCQTFKFEAVDSNNNKLSEVTDAKPLPMEVFSPKKSAKEPNEPNPALTKVAPGGVRFNLYGRVDAAYAERMGISTTRSCLDCVRAGTNAFFDDATKQNYECKFTGELVVLVRKVAFRGVDPKNPMGSVIHWINVSELGSEYINKPTIFVMPLVRSDMFNGIGGDYGYSVDLKKAGLPQDITTVGEVIKELKRKFNHRVSYGKTLPGLDVKPSVFYQMPIELYLTPLAKPIGSKTHCLLSRFNMNQDAQLEASKRAEHAWYVYAYEKGIANGDLDPSSDYPDYDKVANNNQLDNISTPALVQKEPLAVAPQVMSVAKPVTSAAAAVATSNDVEPLVTEGADFWAQVRKSTRS